MRILHLLGTVNLPRNPDKDPASGIVRAALETARIQARDGHRITIAASGSHRWSALWEGVTLLSLPEWKWAKITVRGRTLDLRKHAAFIWLTLTHKYHVIHSHNYGYLRFLKSPHKVMHFHADPLAKDFSAAVWKPEDFATVKGTASHVVAVSQFIKKQLVAAMGLDTVVSVVPNGVHLDAFSSSRLAGERAKVRTNLHIPPDAVVFLYCGAINRVKGVLNLAHAFQEVAKVSVHAYLVIAGSSSLWGGNHVGDPYESEVQNILAVPEVDGRVKFTGLLGHDNLPALYQAADVVVVPSLTEAFGMSALEAMASGKPVIASNTGGLPELIRPENGILIEPGNVQDLVAAMMVLIQSPTTRNHLGSNGRHAAQHMTWASAGRIMRDVYAAMGRRGRAHGGNDRLQNLPESQGGDLS